jgi:protein-disulfide isomerase
MRTICRWGAVVVTTLFLVAPVAAGAQVSRDEFEALKSEVGSLREAVKAQSEILRQILDRAGALGDSREVPFKEVRVAIDGAAAYGKADAKVTIVEFSDYQCPFCARYSHSTFPQIERDYIETGRVKYVFRDYPIEAAHPQAFKAHEAVHCAAEQGKRREMHEKVFSSQRAMSVPDLTAHAQTLGLEKSRFEKCLSSGSHSTKVRTAISAGQQAGVRGTPTFFLGLTEANGTHLKAVRRIVGAQPYGVFKAAIDELLSSR